MFEWMKRKVEARDNSKATKQDLEECSSAIAACSHELADPVIAYLQSVNPSSSYHTDTQLDTRVYRDCKHRTIRVQIIDDKTNKAVGNASSQLEDLTRTSYSMDKLDIRATVMPEVGNGLEAQRCLDDSIYGKSTRFIGIHTTSINANEHIMMLLQYFQMNNLDKRTPEEKIYDRLKNHLADSYASLIEKTNNESTEITFGTCGKQDQLIIPTLEEHVSKKRILLHRLNTAYDLDLNQNTGSILLCRTHLQIYSVRNNEGNIDWEYRISTEGQDPFLRDDMATKVRDYFETGDMPVAWPLTFSTRSPEELQNIVLSIIAKHDR